MNELQKFIVSGLAAGATREHLMRIFTLDTTQYMDALDGIREHYGIPPVMTDGAIVAAAFLAGDLIIKDGRIVRGG